MLFIYKLRKSQSQHLQKQCQKDGGVGYIPTVYITSSNKLFPAAPTIWAPAFLTMKTDCLLGPNFSSCLIATLSVLGLCSSSH